ncbi:sialate O-acetylesterase-like [Babylonia areolata]|uniref:sialate O-acetylesterase-like n=1 Tax=Babylonia areolata TaxID=304850 RepID=UPI003FD6B181
MKGKVGPLVLVISFLWPNALCQHVVHMSQRLSEQPEQNWRRVEAVVKATKEFSFASYYGDHMVLQRAPQRATVWGYHPEPGYRIILQVKGRKIYSAVVNDRGVWSVLLEAETSGGPFSIVAMSETRTIQLNDVLFGDVWLCSGQSNMVFTLKQALNWTEEVEEAEKLTKIRVFTAQLHFSKVPLTDLESVLEPWSLPRNDTLGHGGQYFSAVCWLYGKYLYQRLGVPLGLIDTTWGGTPIESWMSADALRKCGLKPQTAVGSVAGSGDHGELWNAMINPFLPLTLYGVLWDQGESDSIVPSYRDNYNCTFPVMIDDWRSKFSAGSGGQTSPDFPFGFVQIGSSDHDFVTSSGFPDIRWHQTADYGFVPNPRMHNVFMAVSMDITDFNSPYAPVHTRDKQDIAHRLFLGGLSVAYNLSALWQGPLPISVTRTPAALVLDYGHSWTLELRQREGFELCCAVGDSRSCQPEEGKAEWVPTPITDANATHLQLYPGVCGGPDQLILGLRYAWRLSPCPFKRCAVYSKENALPGPPFVMYNRGLRSGGNVTQGDETLYMDWTKPVYL